MSIELKMGLTADIDQNLVLLDCQPGIEIRTGDPPRFKIGDGVSKWSALSYASPDPNIYTDTAITNYGQIFSIGSITFAGTDLYSGSQSSNLGLATAKWGSVYSNNTYANTITSYDYTSIRFGCTLKPSTSATCTLGTFSKGEQWKNIHLQYASGTDIPSVKNGAGVYFGTDTYPSIYRYSTSLYFHPSGSSGTDSFILEPSFFYSPTGSAALGKSGSGWTALVLQDKGTIRFTSGADITRPAISETTNPADTSKYDLYLGGAYNSNLFYASTDYTETHIVGESIAFNMPDLYRAIIIGNDTTSGFYMSGYDNSSGTSKPSLGRTNQRWGTVYCVTVSESSDSKDKSDIQYITSNSISNTTTRKARAKAASVSNDTSSTISTEDVISFVKNCSPATFVYKGVQNAPATVSEAIISSPEAVHLGLIADDIENDVVFPFVGAKSEFTEDDGTKTSQLSLKPLSIAVAALTACKYLLNEVETLKNQLNNVG